MSRDKLMDVSRIYIAELDGRWWVCDWVPDTYGNSCIDRSLFAFKSKRHAEQFVTAAKRMVQL